MQDRECPQCGNENHLVSPREAFNVYDTRSWRGETSLMDMDSTELVCAWCKSVRIGGNWTRMQSVESRAAELAQNGSKTRSEYESKLTRGD